ncbi:hypothetical protein GCM10010174_87630 [Kutzneria viridogrisea]|uniref:D-alanyl-D-alanine carboxypeptidase-like core domain-containing protein n=2 Tax=Kutzneria TaxID=43356 RepID=W5WLN5_9PSEU|nr:D-alanyl-D-alanine carboxypeptidase family protein [Kutzneria albida]AHI01763.1 hypothetical protein KALB_8406 [Kutzneria albida DSM 43870]MBA8931726.1 LAS superfamily LD-carboxypeptidase LdcB [Kutzneria viridogrisea]
MRYGWVATALGTAVAAGVITVFAGQAVTRVSGSAQPAHISSAAGHPDRPCPVDGTYQDKDPSGMKPAAITAWLDVTRIAAGEGVTLCLHDGKRDAEQQRAEFEDYVRKYGAEVAATYVLPPERSMHVQGTAADVQPRASAQWLEQSRGKYGWCRRYDNEFWHFEYDPSYATGGCPARQPHA